MSRKALLALIGAFVIVVGASVGVTAFVMSRGENTPVVEQRSPTDGNGSGTTTSDSICGLKPADPFAKPTAGATSAKWQQIGQWWLPVSDVSGPAKRTDAGPWSCYSHDQAGAVLAAYTISLRVSGIAENWQQVAREQTMPGPGQRARLAAGLEASSQSTEPKGFQVAAFSGQQATIRYYIHSTQLDISCTMSVAWSAGDWKLQLSDDGSTSTSCVREAPDTFTPWGP